MNKTFLRSWDCLRKAHTESVCAGFCGVPLEGTECAWPWSRPFSSLTVKPGDCNGFQQGHNQDGTASAKLLQQLQEVRPTLEQRAGRPEELGVEKVAFPHPLCSSCCHLYEPPEILQRLQSKVECDGGKQPFLFRG